jgi:hypothetical protein
MDCTLATVEETLKMNSILAEKSPWRYILRTPRKWWSVNISVDLRKSKIVDRRYVGLIEDHV